MKYLLLIPIIGLLSSCASQYKIAGNTSVPMFDGKMLYLKTVSTNKTHNIDSCEVVHGKFSFMGLMDSTVLAELYVDNESVMPLVIENGALKVSINLIDQNVSGGTLNDRLYRFIEKKTKLEEENAENDILRLRLMHSEKKSQYTYDRCTRRAEEINKSIEQLETQFIKENYENVLGPGLFMLLCSKYSHPIMTAQIRDIMANAPKKFTSHPYVRQYIRFCRKNRD